MSYKLLEQGDVHNILNFFRRKCNLRYLLVLETMSPLDVWSKVCMAPFHVRSKVCIAPIHVWSKICKFAPHMNWSNADFAPHMEGSHADFVPHMERRHSFRDQIIAKTTSFANFQREFLKTTMTTFDNKKYFEGAYL